MSKITRSRTRSRRPVVAATCLALALACGGVVSLADADRSGQQGPPSITEAQKRSNIHSIVRVIAFDNSIARLNTSTGALHLLRGTPSEPSTRSEWIEHAPAVSGTTSGFMELQQVSGITFLVDMLNGRTWILNRRGSKATWDEVREVQSGPRQGIPSRR